MPIGYWSLWGQQRSVTLVDLSWPWNSHDARSRVTASPILTPIISTIPIQVNRTMPSCVYSRFRWNLAEGCSSYDVHNFVTWPDLTNFFHWKLRKRRTISYGKFQHATQIGVAFSSEKLMGDCINPPPPPLARVKTDFCPKLWIRPRNEIQSQRSTHICRLIDETSGSQYLDICHWDRHRHSFLIMFHSRNSAFVCLFGYSNRVPKCDIWGRALPLPAKNYQVVISIMELVPFSIVVEGMGLPDAENRLSIGHAVAKI